jgi:hypothetical protein
VLPLPPQDQRGGLYIGTLESQMGPMYVDSVTGWSQRGHGVYTLQVLILPLAGTADGLILSWDHLA